ncbi:BtrH N-terminal domain-containing protein [Streptomyces sp. WAC04114]|uniref:BtrH N-terminal domain-containing protein n=1 Tax=Streptomyces sp. WAC04114 TaxID=2867961 RepID=UPI001C8B9E5B|nr:BtrH N-terminal domain-containing protein [Streptomyces sp. WAC04114]MBX9359809.1 BtrH N-terminal domain-containing protein [Streptomyces sp. WAC04114]
MNESGRYAHRRGIHCESACQCAVLAAGGYDVDEEIVFGLDGGFGFSFFPANGNAPDIVVGKQAIMPLRAARLMGVEVAAHTPKSGDGLARLLASAPAVITRVDLGMLPYWGLEGRTSFGGYFVNVVRPLGTDAFEVSDPAFDEPVTVSAAELQAARSSRNSPPLNPDWKVYVLGAPRRTPQLDRVGPVAVRTLCREVLKPGSRNLGIPGMKLLATTAASWPQSKHGEVEDVDLSGHVVRTDALARQLLHLGRQIESFGTGGGLFRPMIGRYLTRVAESTGDTRYADAADRFLDSGRLWSNLGSALLAAGAATARDDLKTLVDAVADTARSAMDVEKRALTALTTL